MKGFERDTIMYEKGQEAERKNTERERQRADFAEKEKIKTNNDLTVFGLWDRFCKKRRRTRWKNVSMKRK